MDNSINHPSEAEKNNKRMQQLRYLDEESACDLCSSNKITKKKNPSIIVRLKRLLVMWLTGLLMTPLLFHFLISSIETANAAVLMPINSTNAPGSSLTYSSSSSSSSSSLLLVQMNNLSIIATGNAIALPLSDSKGNQVDCMIDPKKGFSNPSNVYQCPASQKCCLEHAKPSCCGSKSTTQIM